jgi:hypothetical protein
MDNGILGQKRLLTPRYIDVQADRTAFNDRHALGFADQRIRRLAEPSAFLENFTQDMPPIGWPVA